MRYQKAEAINPDLQHEPPIVPRQSAAEADHANALRTSARLVRTFSRMYAPEALVADPEPIIEILRNANVHFVLMGTHGVGGWRSQARATQDVDLLITKRDHAKAGRALKEAFPEFVVRDSVVVTRFLDPETLEPVIDLMKPTFDIFKKAFRNSIWVGDSHRVPNLEMALVSKFAAMVPPNRSDDKKFIDAGDITNIVKYNTNTINLGKLAMLADLVYRNGSVEILKLVSEIKEGRKISF